MFELTRRDGLARIGKLETPHGILETPALLPVVNPKLGTVPPRELFDDFGFKAIITNSYIIRSDEKLKERALNEGLHAMLDFPGVIMTDSGTFQSHMYGEVEVKNEDIVSFQRDIGSDIGTVLDIFTEPEWSEEKTAHAVDVTIARTEDAAKLKEKMLLAGVVQGSVYQNLRENCAKRLALVDVDVHPIGGVVPLMEQYRFADLVDVIISSKKGLDPSRPVHLFGAGHPMIFALAALLGCDMFDSASYAKFARTDRFMFPEGTAGLQDMKGLHCHCPACSSHTYEEIVKMKPAERSAIIARHNLWVSKCEIERVKRAILEGDLWELAERRCRAHPALLSALRRLEKHREFLEQYEPLSRDNSLLYTGIETLNRPAFLRYSKRFFARYEYPSSEALVVFEDSTGKPYNRYREGEINKVSAKYNAHYMVHSPFGPVPIELDEIYPIAQSLFPTSEDVETKEYSKTQMEKMSHQQPYPITMMWDEENTMDALEMMCQEAPAFDLDKARVKAVADYQFGKGAGEAFLNGEVKIVKSKSTGKIRNVLLNGEHILSMRANDGFFTLRPPGAKILLQTFPRPRLRVIVKDDAVPFNREGKNVFCAFVEECDKDLRLTDEVLVVDQKDNLVAIGRAMMIREEMLSFQTGVAVKVREGVKE
ncbi:tRNA guanosine(15) transglycosylase TgtA [Candidatus Methanomassiliicoccus intestinalis]|uniref:tRNA guanosine(15) transglycosylase TgtA n=1 Tax=Candidatus Methanomassiliicoccus intestinalis TaxID=1406512 RepID=UPI0037DDC176